jgi:hypothetical protein
MPGMTASRRDTAPRHLPDDRPYDPWLDLRERWPHLQVVVEPMAGRLLGELRYPVIALRAGTTAAQRRCTLTHEIVHLERGIRDCGPWTDREERHVHDEVARRLVSTNQLVRAVRDIGGIQGGPADVLRLAQVLDVARQTMGIRLGQVTPRERARIRALRLREVWSVA